MRGLMMDVPLLVSSILRHAEGRHGDAEIVSRDAAGATRRSTYAETASRSRRLARALDRLGIPPGARVGTLAWNGARHLEIYFAASGSGRVCHTVNPRLFPDRIVRILAHAGDAVLFVVLAEGFTFDEGDVAALYARRVARWMVPTDLRVVADLPHTATGKLAKAVIRGML